MIPSTETRSTSAIRGRRVMVTGGAGFLGRHVCRELRKYAPACIAVPRQRDYDLRDLSAVRRALKTYQPDLVIHLAARVGGIGANRDNPGRYFYDNAIMGIQLMEESRLQRVSKFVTVGTACSYPKNTPVPFREDDLWNGYPEQTNAPYGLAKKMLLVQAQAYVQQYGLNAITLLPVNLYGPGDNFSLESGHVIPALIRKTLEAVEHQRGYIDACGSGQVSREFLFVHDASRAIATATDGYDEPDPINLGSGEEIMIGHLARMICQLCGFTGEIRWNSEMPDGQPRRCLDSSRARHKLGFVARTKIHDGLKETIAWYRRRRSRPVHNPLEEVTNRQPSITEPTG